MNRVAHCACGSVSVPSSGEPRTRCVCHCTNCKGRTGSAFGVSACFMRNELDVATGERVVYSSHHTGEHDGEERYFCARCGTTHYWLSSNRPQVVGVAAGCLPDDSFGVPTKSFTMPEKLARVELSSSCRPTER